MQPALDFHFLFLSTCNSECLCLLADRSKLLAGQDVWLFIKQTGTALTLLIHGRGVGKFTCIY